MKRTSLLILLLFLLWGAGSTYWYVCRIKGFCAENYQTTVTNENAAAEKQHKTEEQKPATVKKRELISFDYGKIAPVIRDSAEWVKTLEQWKNYFKNGRKLIIHAPYYADEPVLEEGKNNGISRADTLKKLILQQIPEAEIETREMELKMISEKSDILNMYPENFQWITDNSFVKEKEGKTLIYFPFNSNREIKKTEIIRYLNELVTILKDNPSWKVEITGYTDNTGTTKSNRWLGKQRAKRIASILIRKGIDPGRLIIKSGGASNPVADNTTKEGRQKNRRVEIKIIKS